MAKIITPKITDGVYSYHLNGLNGNESISIDPKDPKVKEIDEAIAKQITPEMSDKQKTEVIRSIVNQHIAGSGIDANSENINAEVKKRDLNGDGVITSSEVAGNGICCDTAAHTDYFMKKNGVDSNFVYSDVEIDGRDPSAPKVTHAYVVSNNEIVETLDVNTPTYLPEGKTPVGQGAAINYFVPEGAKRTTDEGNKQSQFSKEVLESIVGLSNPYTNPKENGTFFPAKIDLERMFSDLGIGEEGNKAERLIAETRGNGEPLVDPENLGRFQPPTIDFIDPSGSIQRT